MLFNIGPPSDTHEHMHLLESPLTGFCTFCTSSLAGVEHVYFEKIAEWDGGMMLREVGVGEMVEMSESEPVRCSELSGGEH